MSQNTTSTAAWHPEPTFRGTYGILSNCIVTLGLCVWTAVHLDIPEPGHTATSSRKRLGWLLTGMLAPDYLLYVAWYQWQGARAMGTDAMRWNFAGNKATSSTLRRVLLRVFQCRDNEVLDYELEPGSGATATSTRKHRWKRVHDFYVVMGGFVIDTKCDQPFLPQSRSRVVLTPKGVSFLMRVAPDLVPDISPEFIIDKSNSSSVAKLIVCIQAGWFCLQCLGRVIHHLPVSLLELNTFAHTLCTFVTYFLWWNKPLDITEPTVIDEDVARELCAYMWMASSTSNPSDPSLGQKTEFNGVSLINLGSPPRDPETLLRNGVSNLTYPLQLHPGEQLADTGFTVDPSSRRFVRTIHTKSKVNRTKKFHLSPITTLSRVDAERWTLASRAMFRFALPKPQQDLELVVTRTGLSSTPMNILDRAHVLRYSGVFFVAALYGSLHLFAWNAGFPTSGERLWWHVSALFVATFGFLVPLSSLFQSFVECGGSCEIWKFFNAILWAYSAGSLFFGMFVYCAARAFLVIESFRQVFYLPPDVFEIPSWTGYFLHVT